jgi:3-isopropylmalate dehydratase small subunit
MQKFNTLTSITAPLDRANIDTDAMNVRLGNSVKKVFIRKNNKR